MIRGVLAFVKVSLVVSAVASLFISLGLHIDYDRSQYRLSVDFDSLQMHPIFATGRSGPSDESIGKKIVDKAFNETYTHLIEVCGILGESNSLQQCFRKTYQHLKESQPDSSTWPWWFQTLIRDARLPSTGLFGAWHILQFPDPLMQLCVYEKGGTKNWRAVHCSVLQNSRNTNGTTLTNCFTHQGPIATNAKKSVFLRDPLERFLSAFLDKCTTNNRVSQTHCQPNVIFRSNQTDHVADYLQNVKTLFEIFVDTSPLKWDLHFLPLAFQCGGLYQQIEHYDFIGTMNESFHQELGRFIERYPNPILESKVREVFKLEGNENKTSFGTEMQAALHTSDYYTPNTIRKILQYVSIDYKLLNLPIPQWADNILKHDETFLL